MQECRSKKEEENMYLVLFIILMSLVSVLTSLAITVFVNDKRLRNLVKTYGRDIEFMSSAYIRQVDKLKKNYEDRLDHREKLIEYKEKSIRNMEYEKQYLKESILNLLESLEEINNIDKFYKLKDDFKKEFDLIDTFNRREYEDIRRNAS